MSDTDFHPGRLVMVDIPGRHLDADTAAFLREHRIRAVCLFRKNLGDEAEVRELLADLHRVLGPQALIALDQEGGSVLRATFVPQAPSAMALGAAGSDGAACAQAEAVGAAVARALRALGINWNFAPVLDVNSNPANPVIGERSFGAEPDAVARLAGAWMRGSLREGVACCVKHFPGHGDTHEDSHHALPTVNKSLAELLALELRPFAALAGQAPAVMSAHIVYPQLDPEHPATLSRPLLHGLLRERLGYQGVVITDALMMQAVHARWGHARAAVLALQAGADMPLAQGSRAEQAATLQAIGEALADGRLERAALQRSAARLDALATTYPVRPGPYDTPTRAADDRRMHAAWARGLSALRDPQPPAPGARLRVLTQADVASDGVAEAGLPASAVRGLFEGWADVEWCTVPDLARATPADLGPADGRVRVLVSNHRQRYAPGHGLRPDLHLALWNPFQAADIDAPTVVTWGHADGALAALAAWLHGRADAPGVPPAPLLAAPAPTQAVAA
ncbi:beta-N-acetylhexosaminidase [Aquabacterium sp. OR-4]|uniref:beta-N-acetylhexosaminidase n=1 Tax=Aquabacterium sp. OR-4 TaxID=2978127 RepID=UPI0021B2E398|nr:beta-N-acetylhexosaminidase [Aquabacterium sp. OR-4]MDT7836605.1 beta-N-acetylhexosaminidase [Aquabacterium sp. OR-4]